MTYQDSVAVRLEEGNPARALARKPHRSLLQRTAPLPHSCHCDDSILYPLWSAVKILTQQGLVSFFVQKIPGRRKQREPTRHSKAHWAGSQAGRRVKSVEQEGGGGPGCAGRRGHGPPVLQHQDAIMAHGPLSDPVQSGLPLVQKGGSWGAHPCQRARLSLPVRLTRSIYINSVSGWKKEPQSSIS